MSSRKIEDLVPKLQMLYYQFKAKMDLAKIPFIVTCTARTVKEQVALYAQGRQILNEVNVLRAQAQLPPITEAENKNKVTSTLQSKHLVDLEYPITTNDKSSAFDIAILKDGKVTWDLKVNVNKNEIADYMEAGKIGQTVGLTWGGSWTNFKDYPHFQL